MLGNVRSHHHAGVKHNVLGTCFQHNVCTTIVGIHSLDKSPAPYNYYIFPVDLMLFYNINIVFNIVCFSWSIYIVYAGLSINCKQITEDIIS